jgi:hypothetical protein
MIGAYIKPILVITGIATASMIAAFFAPALVLDQLFAGAPTDAVSLAVMRHWGLLVFCFGALLIWAAYRRELRKPVLVLTLVEKIALVIGILLLPLPLKSGAYVVAGSDATFSLLYLLYLAGI